MISFYDGQITDILPVNFSSKVEVKALSHALQQGCRLLFRYSQKLYIYPILDSQPGEILDLLSAELRTQYYRDDMDLESKRNLVKNTLVWHMTAGTPDAVEGLVDAVFGEGKVEEWFEYGGEPYHFRVTTDTGLAFTPEKDKLFREMLQKVKNARSHLQSIDIRRTINQGAYAAVGWCRRYKPAAILCAGMEENTGMPQMEVDTCRSTTTQL